MRYIFASIILLFTLTGCADSHLTESLKASNTHLSQNSSIYIATPSDGIYGNNKYQGSGRQTAQIIQAAFLKKTNQVQISTVTETFNGAINSANKNSFNFLVYPTILHWEDRATEWSSIPDKVEVKLLLVDLRNKQTLESVIIKGKSGLATFGGDHPQDLLTKPIEEFVSTLY